MRLLPLLPLVSLFRLGSAAYAPLATPAPGNSSLARRQEGPGLAAIASAAGDFYGASFSCPIDCSDILLQIAKCGVQVLLIVTIASGLECFCEDMPESMERCSACILEDANPDVAASVSEYYAWLAEKADSGCSVIGFEREEETTVVSTVQFSIPEGYQLVPSTTSEVIEAGTTVWMVGPAVERTATTSSTSTSIDSFYLTHVENHSRNIPERTSSSMTTSSSVAASDWAAATSSSAETAVLAQSSTLVARQEEVSTDQDAWDAIEALAASAIVCPLGCAGVLWTVGVCGVQTVLHTSLAEGLECWCERSTGNFADCVTCVEEDGSASPETLQKIRLASGYKLKFYSNEFQQRTGSTLDNRKFRYDFNDAGNPFFAVLDQCPDIDVSAGTGAGGGG
ncbi:uncharacterized protein JCM10292_000048 [Rhodotorula paludigena]|uniref:uncharacterized protein n=1 Tax=Rhodotorula paludigena TaxID=86838 RepID=UPI003173DC8C